jgi:hypothetical protein
MKLSMTSKSLAVFAIFLAAALLVSPSFRGAATVPLSPSAAVILQADGGAPTPPPSQPPPVPKQTVSASLA